MPFIINPDGTVKLLEVEYDSRGNMSLKRKGIQSDLSSKEYSKIPATSYVKKRKKKKKKQSSICEKTTSPNVQSDVSPQKEIPTNRISPSENLIKHEHRTRLFLTRQSIDTYFKKRMALQRPVPIGIYMYAVHTLKDNLLGYFLQLYEKYKGYCLKKGWEVEEQEKEKKENNKNKRKKKNKISDCGSSNHRSGYTLADIATVSSLHEKSSGEDYAWGRSILGSSHQPKYGYARDRYGRIQERDHIDEDRQNEFRQAQRRQSAYDFSSYDAEDDHDSYYDNDRYD